MLFSQVTSLLHVVFNNHVMGAKNIIQQLSPALCQTFADQVYNTQLGISVNVMCG